MECPNCKKQLADNAKSCPDCGYDFTEQKIEEQKKQAAVATAGCFLAILLFLILSIGGCVNWVFSDDSSTKQTQPKFTQEDIKQASDFITTMEAAGLVKEIKTSCADGTQGCYYFMLDENLWQNGTTYQIKKELAIASEIYASTKEPYKFYEGKGYISGKTLYNMWGIK